MNVKVDKVFFYYFRSVLYSSPFPGTGYVWRLRVERMDSEISMDPCLYVFVMKVMSLVVGDEMIEKSFGVSVHVRVCIMRTLGKLSGSCMCI